MHQERLTPSAEEASVASAQDRTAPEGHCKESSVSPNGYSPWLPSDDRRWCHRCGRLDQGVSPHTSVSRSSSGSGVVTQCPRLRDSSAEHLRP